MLIKIVLTPFAKYQNSEISQVISDFSISDNFLKYFYAKIQKSEMT